MTLACEHRVLRVLPLMPMFQLKFPRGKPVLRIPNFGRVFDETCQFLCKCFPAKGGYQAIDWLVLSMILSDIEVIWKGKCRQTLHCLNLPTHISTLQNQDATWTQWSRDSKHHGIPSYPIVHPSLSFPYLPYLHDLRGFPANLAMILLWWWWSSSSSSRHFRFRPQVFLCFFVHVFFAHKISHKGHLIANLFEDSACPQVNRKPFLVGWDSCVWCTECT